MAQINFSIKDKFDELLEKVSSKFGVAKSDYVKSLILEDLKNFEINQNGKKR